MNLKNHIALITGGGRAIGRAIGICLAQNGADVALVGPLQEELDEAARQIEKLQRRVFTAAVDVSIESQIVSSVEHAVAELGPIDLLVNNAGITGPTAYVHDVSRSEWDEVMEVNLTGAFLCSKAVVPSMIERRSGKIINISSVAGKMGYALRAPYCVSKWGLIGLTLTQASELGPYNIQVNAVCPGPVEGQRMQALFQQRAHQQGRSIDAVKREYMSNTALGKMVQEEDIATMVSFLASSAGNNITGQAIDVSAGWRV